MSIIIDGMDQKSTSLPGFLVTPKSLSSMWKLPTHITGVIVHGRGHHSFIDFKEVPHDSNLTINVLLQTLLKYRSLPATLYLQLDNCGRENKNRYVLALCCLLVELEIFKKVSNTFSFITQTRNTFLQFDSFACFISTLFLDAIHLGLCSQKLETNLDDMDKMITLCLLIIIIITYYLMMKYSHIGLRP